jgi:hypothetical protein
MALVRCWYGFGMALVWLWYADGALSGCNTGVCKGLPTRVRKKPFLTVFQFFTRVGLFFVYLRCEIIV